MENSDTTPEGVILKVSACKDPGYVKRVAGAIGWQMRDHGTCKMRAVKMDAVNTSVKAIAIINHRVSQAGVVLSMNLFFSQAEGVKADGATAISMNLEDVGELPRPEKIVEYRVSGKKEDENIVTRLSSAVSAQAKEGVLVRMRCIGPTAVYRGVLAATVAKGQIYPNGLLAVVVPSWDSMTEEGKPTVSLLNLDFWGKRIS